MTEISLDKKIEMLKALRGPQQTVQYLSLPIGDVLLVVFVTLKLAEIGKVATWSWWWVTAPFWIPLVYITLRKYVGNVRNFLKLDKAKKEEPIISTEDLE